jgi:hypothetical protein
VWLPLASGHEQPVRLIELGLLPGACRAAPSIQAPGRALAGPEPDSALEDLEDLDDLYAG